MNANATAPPADTGDPDSPLAILEELAGFMESWKDRQRRGCNSPGVDPVLWLGKREMAVVRKAYASQKAPESSYHYEGIPIRPSNAESFCQIRFARNPLAGNKKRHRAGSKIGARKP